MDAAEELARVAAEVSVCTRCKLHRSRKKAVPGEGPAEAEVMFIGEGPGYYENEQGRPFVGASGKFLDELLASVGLRRETVFIANVVKCRPPENRDPEPEEIQACSEYLERQIEVINPKVIVTLGRFSMGRFLPQARISSVHGKALRVNGRAVMPMYHPAAALHQAALKTTVQQDFLRLPRLMAKITQDGLAQSELTGSAAPDPDALEEKTAPPEPKQLSLF